jgi:hypothetical protein
VSAVVRSRAEAEEALRLARVDPAAVRALAGLGTGWEPLTSDPETAAIAERALGVAARELHDLPAARHHLERAHEIAREAGLTAWLREVQTDLAVVLTNSGQLADALARLDEDPLAGREGPTGVRVEFQRGIVLHRLGRVDDAAESYRRALAGMRRTGDRLGEARVLVNRALLHAYGGRLQVADAELARAGRLYRQLGYDLEAAYAEHNRGFVATRRGDIPAALRAYDGAARSMAELDVTQPAALLDYCETLLRANLIAEARAVGQQAVEQLEEAGLETDLAESRLLLAEVALAGRDLDTAEHLAVLAQFAFLSQNRQPWEVMARYAWLRVRWERGDRSHETMAAARALASDLRNAGWAASATHAGVLAARIALERGEVECAEVALQAAARHRRRAPAEIRIQAWHAEALLRWQRGDARGAQSALRAGMRTLSTYRASLGATELRVNAGSQASDLSDLAIQIAIRCGEASRVLAWAERSRASTLRLPPVRPPADDELAARLSELRALDSDLQEAAATGQDTGAMLRRKASLEDVIRQKSWHASGGVPDLPEPPRLDVLRRVLGDRVLVEFVECEGELFAVTVRDRRTRLVRIAPIAEVDREIEGLRFALNRMASGRGAPGTQHVILSAFTQAADRLDTSLFGPLRSTVADRPLVIVPTGALHNLPWPVLPSCRGRSVAVSPSAAIWLQAVGRRSPATGTTLLAAGPGVPHAQEELRELVAIYPGARRLQGAAATTRSVTAALDGADLAHVIAHGSFRADNPLFSSLRMTDGPLTVYELERLTVAPHRVVLSACNAGLSAVRPGNELLGLSSVLFALGTATLIASLVLVGGSETRGLMVEFHRRLAEGRDAPTALAEAQETAGRDDPRALASAASFVCLGA